MVDERCFGSYVHGILDNSAVIEFILQPFSENLRRSEFDLLAYRESQYDLLADWLREYVDIKGIYEILSSND